MASTRRRHKGRRACIGRVPSWQVEADLAAGHLVRLLADDAPAPVPLHPDVSAVAAGFAEDQDLRWGAGAASIGSTQGPRREINRIIVQFLNHAKWPWYTKPLINHVS
jgi:hypothetical protein